MRASRCMKEWALAPPTIADSDSFASGRCPFRNCFTKIDSRLTSRRPLSHPRNGHEAKPTSTKRQRDNLANPFADIRRARRGLNIKLERHISSALMLLVFRVALD